LLPTLPSHTTLIDYRGKLIAPGLCRQRMFTIRRRTSSRRTVSSSSSGSSATPIPPNERFDDPLHAREVADFFLTELLAHTVRRPQWSSRPVHPQSVDAFFESARAPRRADDLRQDA
jgi:guanine deaminase